MILNEKIHNPKKKKKPKSLKVSPTMETEREREQKSKAEHGVWMPVRQSSVAPERITKLQQGLWTLSYGSRKN